MEEFDKAKDVENKLIVSEEEINNFPQLKEHLGHSLVTRFDMFSRLAGVMSKPQDKVYCVDCEKDIDGLSPIN